MIFAHNCRQLVCLPTSSNSLFPWQRLVDCRIEADDDYQNTAFRFLKRRGKKLKLDHMLHDTSVACKWSLKSTIYLRINTCSEFFQLSWKLVANLEIPPFPQYKQSHFKWRFGFHWMFVQFVSGSSCLSIDSSGVCEDWTLNCSSILHQCKIFSRTCTKSLAMLVPS